MVFWLQELVASGLALRSDLYSFGPTGHYYRLFQSKPICVSLYYKPLDAYRVDNSESLLENALLLARSTCHITKGERTNGRIEQEERDQERANVVTLKSLNHSTKLIEKSCPHLHHSIHIDFHLTPKKSHLSPYLSHYKHLHFLFGDLLKEKKTRGKAPAIETWTKKSHL